MASESEEEPKPGPSTSFQDITWNDSVPIDEMSTLLIEEDSGSLKDSKSSSDLTSQSSVRHITRKDSVPIDEMSTLLIEKDSGSLKDSRSSSDSTLPFKGVSSGVCSTPKEPIDERSTESESRFKKHTLEAFMLLVEKVFGSLNDSSSSSDSTSQFKGFSSALKVPTALRDCSIPKDSSSLKDSCFRDITWKDYVPESEPMFKGHTSKGSTLKIEKALGSLNDLIFKSLSSSLKVPTALRDCSSPKDSSSLKDSCFRDITWKDYVPESEPRFKGHTSQASTLLTEKDSESLKDSRSSSDSTLPFKGVSSGVCSTPKEPIDERSTESESRFKRHTSEAFTLLVEKVFESLNDSSSSSDSTSQFKGFLSTLKVPTALRDCSTPKDYSSSNDSCFRDITWKDYVPESEPRFKGHTSEASTLLIEKLLGSLNDLIFKGLSSTLKVPTALRDCSSPKDSSSSKDSCFRDITWKDYVPESEPRFKGHTSQVSTQLTEKDSESLKDSRSSSDSTSPFKDFSSSKDSCFRDITWKDYVPESEPRFKGHTSQSSTLLTEKDSRSLKDSRSSNECTSSNDSTSTLKDKIEELRAEAVYWFEKCRQKSEKPLFPEDDLPEIESTVTRLQLFIEIFSRQYGKYAYIYDLFVEYEKMTETTPLKEIEEVEDRLSEMASEYLANSAFTQKFEIDGNSIESIIYTNRINRHPPLPNKKVLERRRATEDKEDQPRRSKRNVKHISDTKYGKDYKYY